MAGGHIPQHTPSDKRPSPPASHRRSGLRNNQHDKLSMRTLYCGRSKPNEAYARGQLRTPLQAGQMRTAAHCRARRRSIGPHVGVARVRQGTHPNPPFPARDRLPQDSAAETEPGGHGDLPAVQTMQRLRKTGRRPRQVAHATAVPLRTRRFTSNAPVHTRGARNSPHGENA